MNLQGLPITILNDEAVDVPGFVQVAQNPVYFFAQL